jgi:tetratricopeptide (TPR) repeat protein
MLDVLNEYCLDTENAKHNFNLALEYDKIGQTASAISFYLRAAERSEDPELSYTAILKMGLCFERQEGRSQTVQGAYLQAINIIPSRPEAYYLLSRIKRKHSLYHESYTYIEIALSICSSELDTLPTDVGYPGHYGLLFEKAISGWWWGKKGESKNLHRLLLENYFDEMNDDEKNILIHNNQNYNFDIFIGDNFFELEYKKSCEKPSNINENLHILHNLSKECKHVTEMGVRDGISTRAFLNSDVILRSYDLYIEDEVNKLFEKAKSLDKDVQYIGKNVLEVEIEETDLLFIDTWHCYDQLKEELKLHSNKVRKFIVFHDTQTFGVVGEPYTVNIENGYIENPLGLLPAIIEFMIENPEWKFKIHKTNNNGLTVIQKTFL